MTKVLPLLIILLGFITYQIRANNSISDSLQFEISETIAPNKKAHLTLEYCWSSRHDNLEKSLELTTWAKQTLLEQEDIEGVAIANSYLGAFYFLQNQNSKAISYLKEAEKTFKATSNYDRLSRVYNNLGIAYAGVYDYNSSIYYYNQSLKIKEQHLQDVDISTNLVNIATIYYDQGDYEKCIKTNEEALIITLNTGNLNSTAIIYSNLGASHERMKHYKRAINYNLKALDIYQNEISSPIALIRTYSNLGAVYLSQNDFEIAEYYFRKSLEINEKVNNASQNAVTLNNLAELYRKQSKLIESLNYAQQALTLANQSNNTEEELVSLKTLSEIEKELNNYQKAYQFYVEYITLSDSLMEISEYHNTQLALAQNEIAIENIKKEKDLTIQQLRNKKTIIWHVFGWALTITIFIWILVFIKKPNIKSSGINILNYCLSLFWISWVFLYLFSKSNLINTLGTPIFSMIIISVIIIGAGIHTLLHKGLTNRIIRND